MDGFSISDADERYTRLRLAWLRAQLASGAALLRTVADRLCSVLADDAVRRAPAVLREVCQRAGAVPVEVLLQLPAVANVTTEPATVLAAAAASPHLVAHPDGATVGRMKPFPPNLLDPVYRSVVVEFGDAGGDEDTVTRSLEPFGEVWAVRRATATAGHTYFVAELPTPAAGVEAVRCLSDASAWRAATRWALATRRLAALTAPPLAAAEDAGGGDGEAASGGGAAARASGSATGSPGTGVVSKLSHTFGYITPHGAQPAAAAAADQGGGRGSRRRRGRATNNMLLFEMVDVDCHRALKVGDRVWYLRGRDARTERPIATQVRLDGESQEGVDGGDTKGSAGGVGDGAGGGERHSSTRRPPRQRVNFGSKTSGMPLFVQALGPDGTLGFTRPRTCP